ncbi:hypothetical protein BDW22DRAFT_1358720 [Trametopsis cervina]|nr:hypothetical protein BDW22DRAFT_1358720 [Trametopsis cervina]
MEIPQHLFFVPALNSHHSGATKVTADTRKRFDDVNERKPKLKGLFRALKPSLKTQGKRKELNIKPASSQRVASPSLTTDVVADRVRSQGQIKSATRITAIRQTATSPPENSTPITRRLPVKIRMSPPVPNKTSVSPTLASVKARVPVPSVRKVEGSKSKSPLLSSSRPRIVQQLHTPPATPPLDSDASRSIVRKAESTVKIPRSTAMVFSKAALPRSKAMTFKQEQHPVTKKIAEVPVRRSAAKPVTPVQKETHKALASTAMPKPVSKPKVVQISVAKINTPIKTSRTPAMLAASKKPTSPKTQVPARVAVAATSSPVKYSEKKLAQVSLLEVKSAEVKVPEVESVAIESKPEIIASELVVPKAEACIEIVCEESPVEHGVQQMTAVDSKAANDKSPEASSSGGSSGRLSPLQVAHSPVIGELQGAFDRRKTAISGQSSIRKLPIHAKQEQVPIESIRPPLSVVTNNAASGIQARIAAMYASAGVKAPAQPTVIAMGPRVCQFRRPDLLETDKASRDAKIQREIEALRNMNRVGTTSAAIVRTRAFGGSGTANAGAMAAEERAIPLHLRKVVERVRRERSEGLTQEI